MIGRFTGHQSYVLLCTETTLSKHPVIHSKSSCDVHLFRSLWPILVTVLTDSSSSGYIFTSFLFFYPRFVDSTRKPSSGGMAKHNWVMHWTTLKSLIEDHARLDFSDFLSTLLAIFHVIINETFHPVNKQGGWHVFPTLLVYYGLLLY